MTTITIDKKEYDISDPTPEVKAQLDNIDFVNKLILEKSNELQISQTAQIGYSRAMARELEKNKT